MLCWKWLWDSKKIGITLTLRKEVEEDDEQNKVLYSFWRWRKGYKYSYNCVIIARNEITMIFKGFGTLVEINEKRYWRPSVYNDWKSFEEDHSRLFQNLKFGKTRYP